MARITFSFKSISKLVQNSDLIIRGNLKCRNMAGRFVGKGYGRRSFSHFVHLSSCCGDISELFLLCHFTIRFLAVFNQNSIGNLVRNRDER